MKGNCKEKNKLIDKFQTVFMFMLVLMSVFTLILPTTTVSAKSLSKIDNNIITIDDNQTKQLSGRWTTEMIEKGNPINIKNQDNLNNSITKANGNGTYQNTSILTYFMNITNIDFEQLPLNLNFNQWIIH